MDPFKERDDPKHHQRWVFSICVCFSLLIECKNFRAKVKDITELPKQYYGVTIKNKMFKQEKVPTNHQKYVCVCVHAVKWVFCMGSLFFCCLETIFAITSLFSGCIVARLSWTDICYHPAKSKITKYSGIYSRETFSSFTYSRITFHVLYMVIWSKALWASRNSNISMVSTRRLWYLARDTICWANALNLLDSRGKIGVRANAIYSSYVARWAHDDLHLVNVFLIGDSVDSVFVLLSYLNLSSDILNSGSHISKVIF